MADRPNGVVTAQVEENPFLEDAPRQDHPSVFDLYDIRCDVWCGEETRYLGGEIRKREAELIYNEIAQKLPWPAVLLHDNDLLISAWAPAIGRTDFPPGTASDEEHLDLWTPYAKPAAINGT